MPADSPWLTSPDAAQYSHRSKATLAREVKAGRPRAARVGGRGQLLFRREWIDQWLEDQATPIMVPARRRLG
jgi:excisionase family DNA binding protein